MLVLDANILIRAVLGSRVLFLLRKYAGDVDFVAPYSAFQEANEKLPGILQRRGLPVPPALATIETIKTLVQVIDQKPTPQWRPLPGTCSPAVTRTIGRFCPQRLR